MIDRNDFPDDFTWGVATSSYQIEGAVDEDGRAPSIWDAFCAEPGRVKGGDSGAVACDHYHLWSKDLDLIASLGVDAYRFSVAWPRVLPLGTGEVNEKGLDFYERLVDGLLERGLRPFLTLYHWDLPLALHEKGGWTNRETVEAFERYAEVVSARLGDRVHAYATLNEPWCSAYLGYENGEHAPGHHDRREHLQASHHLLLAHGRAMPILRANASQALHGIVLNLKPTEPADEASEADRAAARRHDGFFNRWYLDPLFFGRYPEDVWQGYGEFVPEIRDGDLEQIAAPLDFLGVNYYDRAVVRDAPGAAFPAAAAVDPGGEKTAMGWEVHPESLTRLLLRIAGDYPLPPVYITENGAAYGDRLEGGEVDDRDRRSFIARHLAAVAEARHRGAPVAGYFVWSLMDNFEWAHGYSKRFGIVHVDYQTQERTPKRSALWYRDFLSGGRDLIRD